MMNDYEDPIVDKIDNLPIEEIDKLELYEFYKQCEDEAFEDEAWEDDTYFDALFPEIAFDDIDLSLEDN